MLPLFVVRGTKVQVEKAEVPAIAADRQGSRGLGERELMHTARAAETGARLARVDVPQERGVGAVAADCQSSPIGRKGDGGNAFLLCMLPKLLARDSVPEHNRTGLSRFAASGGEELAIRRKSYGTNTEGVSRTGEVRKEQGH